MYPQRRTRGSLQRSNSRAACTEYFDQCLGGLYRVIGRLLDCLREKVKPAFPVAISANHIEEFVILVTMLPQIQTQVQQRLLQNTLDAKQECNKQTSDAPVAIEKRMDSFELNVSQRRLKKRRGPFGL